MTRIKCYNTDTGHTEVVAEISIPIAPASELYYAEERVAYFLLQDHSTDHVYYIEEEK